MSFLDEMNTTCEHCS